MPQAAAPTVARSRSRVERASFRPSPSFPIRADAFTRQSRNAISPRGCGADITSGLTNSTPALPGLDHEGGDGLRARSIHGRENDVEVGEAAVGNQGLGPVENVGVAVLPGFAGDGMSVRTRLGLGHGESAHRVAGDGLARPGPPEAGVPLRSRAAWR